MRKKTRLETSFILFDVIYQDGTKTSYRKVPASEIHELDGIKTARAFKGAGSQYRRPVGNPEGTREGSSSLKAIDSSDPGCALADLPKETNNV